MRSLILSLLLFPTYAAANYYDDPKDAGRHWEEKSGGVCYENDEVFFMCGGLEITYEKRFPKETLVHWKVVDPNLLLAKSPEGVKLTGEEAATIVLKNLAEPFYDKQERRMVHILGGGLAIDAIGTAVGLGGGICSEAGPVAGHVPVLSLLINGWYFLDVRSGAKKSPRFFTHSKNKINYISGATHAVAGLHNILTCS